MRRGGGGGGGRRGRGGGGGGGRGGGYDRRDARFGGGRGDWGRDERRRLDRRTPSPLRRPPRRSPSPVARRPPRRSPSPVARRPPRRSPSPVSRRHRRTPSPPRRGVDDDVDDFLPRRGYARAAAPYRDRSGSRERGGMGGGGRYGAPPAYMLPDHPSDLGKPSPPPPPRGARKESEFLGGAGGRRPSKDGYFGGGARGRSSHKEGGEFMGEEAGVALRVSATATGRTSSMYMERSPLPPVVLPPPPTVRYPTIPPENGFLTGGSAMDAEGLDGANTRLRHDGGDYQYRGDRVRDPYVGRSREIERDYGGRDAVLERDRGVGSLYSSKGALDAELAPSTQLKPYAGSSSSMLAKERSYGVHVEPGYEPSNGYPMDRLGRPSHDTLGHVSDHAPRFSERPLEHGSGHDEKILLNITRQTHSKHPPRAASMENDAHEYGRRDLGSDTYLAPEKFYANASRVPARHILGPPSLTGLSDERIENQARLLPRRMEEDEEHNVQQHEIHHGDSPRRYRRVNHRYSPSPEAELFEFESRPVHQPEFGRDFSDQEVSPMGYRERSQRAAYRGRQMDTYLTDDSTPGLLYYYDDDDDDDMGPYEQSPERSRSSDMVDLQDGYEARHDMPVNRDVFSRIGMPNDFNEGQTDVEQGYYPHSNTSGYGRSQYKPMSQRLSIPIAESQFGGSAMYGRGRGGWMKNAKKRLRSAFPQSHVGYASGTNEFNRPNKHLKLAVSSHNGPELNHEDSPDDADLSVQKDPPEGSEEFSKQVHQAFLKYTKLLNDSPAMQKGYREAPKGSLSCCVCDRVSRKFVDIDALISHAYNTCKAGLKTKHLGFHKALCVLMGWNWQAVPDVSKAYHSMPDEEVKAMKEDLMLWPPVVIIHNSSIASKEKSTEAKIVSIEEIEGVLRDIGVACEKAKIRHGRPDNKSVFLVKFLPTMSGFQEAMKIHEHFATKNQGKEDFEEIKGKKAPVDKLEELLYGHIAVAEDLGYLDGETKKRCVVSSKNEIEAKADATLNLDS